MQWTQVEKALEHLVWELASMRQPTAQAVTTHIPTMVQLDIAKTLAGLRLKGTDLEDRLRMQLNLINNVLRPKRNKFIHGIWGPTASAGKIALLETTARGELKFSVGDEMTAEDILAVAAEIDAAHFQLVHLTFDISSHLGQVATINV